MKKSGWVDIGYQGCVARSRGTRSHSAWLMTFAKASNLSCTYLSRAEKAIEFVNDNLIAKYGLSRKEAESLPLSAVEELKRISKYEPKSVKRWFTNLVNHQATYRDIMAYNQQHGEPMIPSDRKSIALPRLQEHQDGLRTIGDRLRQKAKAAGDLGLTKLEAEMNELAGQIAQSVDNLTAYRKMCKNMRK